MKKRLTKEAAYNMVRDDYTMLYRPMPKEFKELFPVVTIEILSKMGFHFTEKHNGKMSGMQSLSTTCKCNPICKARIKAALAVASTDNDDLKKALRKAIESNPLSTEFSICGFCFSDSQQDYMTSMVEPLSRNYEILNNGIIHKDWLPVINALYFRGESFGDFASVSAVVNFYNLAKANKTVHITAWTKNINFFIKAMEDGYKKPSNFKLILSSRFINKPATIPEKAESLVNAIFTVYTKQYAEKYNITINCGARACLSCLRCYTLKNKLVYVNELLK